MFKELMLVLNISFSQKLFLKKKVIIFKKIFSIFLLILTISLLSIDAFSLCYTENGDPVSKKRSFFSFNHNDSFQKKIVKESYDILSGKAIETNKSLIETISSFQYDKNIESTKRIYTIATIVKTLNESDELCNQKMYPHQYELLNKILEKSEKCSYDHVNISKKFFSLYKKNELNEKIKSQLERTQHIESTRNSLKNIGGDVFTFKNGGQQLRGHYFSADGLINYFKKYQAIPIKIETKNGDFSYGIKIPISSNYNGDDLKHLHLVGNGSYFKEIRKGNNIFLIEERINTKNISNVKELDWPKSSPNRKTLMRLSHLGIKKEFMNILMYGVNAVAYEAPDRNGFFYRLSPHFFTDFKKAYDVFKEKYHVEDKDMIFYGHCNSAAQASYMTKYYPQANIILDRTYDNLSNVAQTFIATDLPYILADKLSKDVSTDKNKLYFSFLNKLGSGMKLLLRPLSFLLLKNFDNEKNLREREKYRGRTNLGQVALPTAIDDSVATIEQTNNLLRQYPEITHLPFRGLHFNPWSSYPTAHRQFIKFFKQIDAYHPILEEEKDLKPSLRPLSPSNL